MAACIRPEHRAVCLSCHGCPHGTHHSCTPRGPGHDEQLQDPQVGSMCLGLTRQQVQDVRPNGNVWAVAAVKLAEAGILTQAGVDHLESIAARLYGEEVLGHIEALQPHIFPVRHQNLHAATPFGHMQQTCGSLTASLHAGLAATKPRTCGMHGCVRQVPSSHWT